MGDDVTTTEAQVAVYIDFDNIVISRYNVVHGNGTFHKHKVRETAHLPETVLRSVEATVDLDAILDFAATLGTVTIIRAYADWSAPFNSRYRDALVARAVDLTQLFPTTPLNKNTADIRLAVDVMEDLFRLDGLTHVVIVSGDSDFVPLAQRVRRLGRRAVGIGMASTTSAALAGACSAFVDYDALPGVTSPALLPDAARPLVRVSSAPPSPPPAAASLRSAAQASPPKAPKAPITKAAVSRATKPAANTPKKGPTGLLVRALQIAHAEGSAPWLLPASVKQQMVAIDPTFTVKGTGFASFTTFITSRAGVVEVDPTDPQRRMRLRPAFMIS